MSMENADFKRGGRPTAPETQTPRILRGTASIANQAPVTAESDMDVDRCHTGFMEVAGCERGEGFGVSSCWRWQQGELHQR